MADDYSPGVYPSPLLSHVEVSTRPVAFFDTLRRFHSAMGTRFMIPVIGGKELNLHQLYVQVTQRGGLEKVILERRWRDVTATFNFPPTTTSASFVLRKYYLSLLHHYEQVYFFRTRGPLVAPSAILQTKTAVNKLEQSPDQSYSDPTVRWKRAHHSPRPSKVVPPPSQTVQEHKYVSSDAPPASTALESIPATDVNGAAGSNSAATALTVENTHPVVPATPCTIKARELTTTSCVAQAPTTVENKPANDVNGVLGSHSYASTPTSGESTPTAERSVISNGDGIQEATPSCPFSITPTFVERASTGAHNLMVSGTIDGKFEHGYFVTVRIGTQILHGVLYHVPPLAAAYSSLHQANRPPPGPSTSTKSPSNAINDPYIPQTRSVQRRRKYKNRPSDHPKPNRSAYNFFFAENHAKLKVQYPHKEREYSKMIGESWNKLTGDERRVYDDYGKRDKERYRRELQEYRERKMLVQPRGVLKVRGVVRENETVKSKEVVMAEAS